MTLRGFFTLIGNAVLAAIAGGIFVPIAVFIVTLIANSFISACGSPGDSGGCAMGAAGIAIASVPFGAGIGFALALYAGLKPS